MKIFKRKSRILYITANILWFIAIYISSESQIRISKESIRSLAINQASTAWDKDRVYREWASVHGGVYVPITEETLPNPYLSHIPDRDVVTKDGQKLTLINPAYMTRQVHELGNDLYKLKGKITSLKPLNPINSPDNWETKALTYLDKGLPEYYEFVNEDGNEKLRYIKSMITEESCLKCHEFQGYEVGDVRGGVAITVPMEPMNETLSIFVNSVYSTHLFIWIIGVIAISLIYFLVKKSFITQFKLSGDLELSKDEEQKEREYLSVTLNSIGEGVITIDNEGLITNINPVALSLTVYTQESALGQDINSIFTIKSVSDNINIDIINLINQSKEGNITQKSILVSSNKIEHLITYSVTNIHENSGMIIGHAIVFRDISKEDDLQKQLIQSQKLDAIGQLTNGIAHDFNNMIGGMLGSAELLKDRVNNDEKSLKYLSLIIDSGVRASKLTSKLLSFSRKSPDEKQPINIHRTIESAKSLLENTLDKNINIYTFLQSKKVIVYGDESQLLNIFINLCINSSHAMPSGGTIKISTQNIDNNIKIVVSDTGFGIPKESISKIFDPYFTTKDQGKGTGLGLSVIYGTIKRLNGSINVESTENEGTTFTIYLPCSEEVQFENSNNSQIEVEGVGNILLIEDEEILRITGEEILSSIGFKVFTAENGKDAIEIFIDKNQSFCLVVLDMIMPVMDGKECAKKIRELNKDIPILVTSGFSNQKDIEDIKLLKKIHFLSKPYTIKDLKVAISNILD